MKIVKWLSFIGMIVMGSAIAYGLITTNFFVEGGAFVDLTWGKITLIDIYIAFSVVIGWIIYRESSKFSMIIWTILVLVLGSFGICTYIFFTALECKDDSKKFMLGKHDKE